MGNIPKFDGEEIVNKKDARFEKPRGGHGFSRLAGNAK